MSEWVRHLLLCCSLTHSDSSDDEGPALKISSPTDFRREDVTLALPGLTPAQQRFLREKAAADAQRMWEHLQPLKSSPSGTFAERPAFPTYEEFTTPRPAPATTSPKLTTSPKMGESMVGRGVKHMRKISGALSKPLGGYQAVGGGMGASPYEMRSLMESSKTVNPGKTSGDSFSVGGSEMGEGDRDSGKGGLRV